MRLLLGLTLFVVAAFAAVFVQEGSATAQSALPNCKEAGAFLERQVEAGVDRATLTRPEIQWALVNQYDGKCTTPPAELVQRMGGVPPTPTHTQRINCHVAFDYLLDEMEGDSHYVQADEKEWGSRHIELIDSGQRCAAPPEFLALRARGHTPDNRGSIPYIAAAADSGDPEAGLEIGIAYVLGTLVGKDVSKGFATLEQAALDGSADAAFEVGVFFEQGKVTDSTPAEAVDYYTRAAEGGNLQALGRLAMLYKQGGGIVKRDPAKAYRYLTMLAERGQLNALSLLSQMAFDGEGTRKDPRAAIAFDRTLAQTGSPLGAAGLISHLLQAKSGKEILASEAEIWTWWDQARRTSDPGIRTLLDDNKGKLVQIFGELRNPPPPPPLTCKEELICDVYVSNNGRQSSKICAPRRNYMYCGPQYAK